MSFWYKKICLLFLICVTVSSFAQNKKPEYIIIANDKVITEQELNGLAEQGLMKSMNKGVSEPERNRYAKLLGEKIGEKEFIIVIELFTKEELLKNKEIAQKLSTETAQPSAAVQEYKVSEAQIAPDFTVKMLDNSIIQLSSLKGKVVLLNFWATWCAPCLMEFYDMPDLILNPLKNEDFMFIPVAIGEDKETVKKRMDKLNKDGITFNVGYDKEKNVWNQYATGAIPKNIVIDKEGVIRYLSTGNSEGGLEKLVSEIKKLL